ncbi:MAG: ABC transporter ATP-binding protein [Phycisphaerales bacterium]|nr:ABC transporter ATP-binding protein [Phycisphaerales bacterium]
MIGSSAHATVCQGPLTARDVTILRGGQALLADIQLTLRPDECLVLVGPNGSGKTTLLRVLLGLLAPTHGTVALGTQPLRRVPAHVRARFAAYVPQGLARTAALRVWDVVAGGRYVHTDSFGRLGAAGVSAVSAAIEHCGLSALAERAFSTLSGGERQKTLLAAAIAQDARMLFLDEPNTALDPGVQLDFVRILYNWRRRGRGFVLVSHDLQMPAVLGGRVIALRGGRVAADGPAERVLQPEQLAEIYGAPFAWIGSTGATRRLVLPDWWHDS